VKKALILHGTSGNSQGEWFGWLKTKLELKGYQVWVPDLPGAEEPDINLYNPYILKNCPFQIDEETVIVGHSSGAAAAMGLVQVLPNRVEKIISVAGFVDDLDYEPVKKMYASWIFNWRKIKKQADKIIAIYSDDDPFVPVKHARELHKLVGAEKVLIPGQKHFSVSTNNKYTEFPEILKWV
jgi:hypothetical protein